MIQRISKSKTVKVFSVFLAINILAQIGFPTMAFGLTAGPTQPEVGSFQQVNTSEMVNLFTGDFSYNLPLLTVPGPNGGYPINLVYNGQVGMEQEASWVGLGWNVNAGAITRNLRGLPDDFNGQTGDEITKRLHQKTNRTISFAGSTDLTEFFGADLKASSWDSINLGLTFKYNNYSGLSVALNSNLSNVSDNPSFIQGSLSADLDSKRGLSISPGFSMAKSQNKSWYFDSKFTFSSREGLQNVSLAFNKRNKTKINKRNKEKLLSKVSGRYGGTSDFASSSFVPAIIFPMKTASFSFSAKLGTGTFGLTQDVDVKAAYSQSKLKDNEIKFPAYGYLYAEENDNETTISDFNREKEVPVSRHTPALPIPSATYDLFTVDGHGVGGTFRTFRSDAGIFTDSKFNVNNPIDVGLGGEFDAQGLELKGGVDVSYNFSTNYSGPWRSGNSLVGKNDFLTQQIDSKTEPSYFKFLGESQAINYDNNSYPFNDQAYRVQLGLEPKATASPVGSTVLPFARGTVDYGNDVNFVNLKKAEKTDRDKRNKSISYLTRAELRSVNKQYYLNGGAYSYSNNDSHIGEFTVTNENGMRYVYGLPLYSNEQRDVSLSVEHSNLGTGALDKTTFFKSSVINNGDNNKKGLSHSYSETITPKYTHSWLITEVLSSDYVDATGDGPTNDDLGYWTKFEYKKAGEIEWRVPFNISGSDSEGNLAIGAFSNTKDDQASFSYGKKDVVYLKKIETKTHYAEFYTSSRNDAYGVIDEKGGKSTANVVQKLDEIRLYKKNSSGGQGDLIKTIHFTYKTNGLCQGVYNSDTNAGKLTLESIHFTYLNNTKGVNQKYEFGYEEIWADDFSSSTTNSVVYNPNLVNRWGTYEEHQPFISTSTPKIHYPYCNQLTSYTKENRDKAATAWCLTSITLPSKAKIMVKYEQDDYAYVQNLKATQMYKILGTGTSTSSINTGNDLGRIKVADNYLFFQLPDPTQDLTTDEKNRIKENLNDVYFKAYVKLKKAFNGTGPIQSDYVEGYMDVEDIGTTTNQFGQSYVGWAKIKMVNPKGITKELHPIRLAAITELKFNRQDLISGQPDLLSDISSAAKILSGIGTIITLFKGLVETFSGFYNTALLSGWGKHIDVYDDTNFPSYLRLNNQNGKKIGGGNRVKSIAVSDAWNEITGYTSSSSIYGQTYDYTIKEGNELISSGVAEFEPMIGGEENALRKPIRYRVDKMLVKNEELYFEEPFNENLFPAPTVGYRKVTVKSLQQKENGAQSPDVTKSRSGTVVHSFYTAKEFPVFVNSTPVERKDFKTIVPIPIPYVGAINYANMGYSQGYSIELNNMHGAQKSVQTYKSGVDVHDPINKAVTEVRYHYKTQGTYSDLLENRLDNSVNTLISDGIIQTQQIGKYVDAYVDMREHETGSYGYATEINLTAVGLLAFIPFLGASINYNESTFRSVVTNKVITRYGVLEKTTYEKDGNFVGEDKNLLFDAETGTPLLTTTTNNFGNPVYTYNYPAHWYYQGMEGAYKNIGATVNSTSHSMIMPGDEILEVAPALAKRYWVETVAPLKLVEASGTSISTFPTGTYKIIRSGRRNHVATNAGYIESLSNPVVMDEELAFINAFNSWTPKNEECNTPSQGSNSFLTCDGELRTVEGCVWPTAKLCSYTCYCGPGGAPIPMNCSYSLNNVYSLYGFSDCIDTNSQGGIYSEHLFGILFPQSIDLTTPSSFNVQKMQLIANGLGQYYAYDIDNYSSSSPIQVEIGTIAFLCAEGQDCGWFLTSPNCFQKCMNVLNASATRFEHEWGYDYADVGLSSSFSTSNPYRYGSKGIWRVKDQHLYDIKRKQENPFTDISKDGIFEKFTIYTWPNHNPEWTTVNIVTRYNPYGFELENKDAIGVYSSALYGYDNSVATAVASNTPYYELAYDGFEDYGINPYSGHGHLNFTTSTSGTPTLSSAFAHTGKKSLEIQGNDYIEYNTTVSNSVFTNFTPNANSKYHISVWVKSGDPTVSNPSCTLSVNNGPLVSTTTSINNQKIEGWQRLELDFQTIGTGTSVNIKIQANGANVLIDDMRVQPFTSGMKSYVYQTNTLWLDAELDDRNYATFYSYDSEGRLVQIKKETKDGLRTIMSNRMNVAQTTP